MFTKLLNHLRGQYLGAIALFVALGGSAYAAVNLPAGSVGNKQLRNGAVTQQKLGKGAVGAANLSAKSIAGYVGFWAFVGSNGKVLESSPRATATIPVPGEGRFLVSWKRPIPRVCFPIVSVTLTAGPGYATTDVAGGSPTTFSGAYVTTFDPNSGSVPESFVIAFICP